jgi:hypothetical protein
MRHDQDPMEECAEFIFMGVSIFAGCVLLAFFVCLILQTTLN